MYVYMNLWTLSRLECQALKLYSTTNLLKAVTVHFAPPGPRLGYSNKIQQAVVLEAMTTKGFFMQAVLICLCGDLSKQ